MLAGCHFGNKQKLSCHFCISYVTCSCNSNKSLAVIPSVFAILIWLSLNTVADIVLSLHSTVIACVDCGTNCCEPLLLLLLLLAWVFQLCHTDSRLTDTLEFGREEQNCIRNNFKPMNRYSERINMGMPQQCPLQVLGMFCASLTEPANKRQHQL